MGLAKLYSRALRGMDAPLVVVEVHVAPGLPAFSIVGLPDTEVKESRDRVRSAIQNSGFAFPARRITVNLAPADLPKDSGRYDLPIAIGVLIASGLLESKIDTDDYEFAGELALDGALRKIGGTLAMAHAIAKNSRNFILPFASVEEALLIGGDFVYPAPSLLAVVKHLSSTKAIEVMPAKGCSYLPDPLQAIGDFSEVKGQFLAKKALEIAASGKHSLLMVGSPGCGKSMLASRFITILPKLTIQESLEVATIYSLSNNGFNVADFGKTPLRKPHHSTSSVALVGGGAYPKPGEISLAHNGVLFLDELPEFARIVLEMLREPLENKTIHITRANQKVEFPANFQLIAAMNPCPCGNYGYANKVCKCSVEQIKRYSSKISEPLLDRIDLVVTMSFLGNNELNFQEDGESSATILTRVIGARDRQLKRQKKLNSELTIKEIAKHCILDSKASELLQQIISKMSLSARAFHKILKIARTIADIDQAELINSRHLSQVVQYKKTFE